MENSCQNIQEQILELVTGSLPTERITEIQRHISQCPACSEYLQALEADDKLLGNFAEAIQPRLARLENNVIDALDREASEKPIGSISIWRTIVKSKITKLAAAAVLLIVVGYAAGRLSAPRPLDAEELRVLETSLKSSLEPVIRQDVVEQLNRDWQLILESSYVQLKDELNQQFRRELNEFAIRTLAASSTVTNQLLTELIQSINAAQAQDRRWVSVALDQIEMNRLQDNAQLRSDLASFAVRASDELRRTKEDMAQMLVYTRPDWVVPDVSENSKTSNERSKK